jgi:hypothetical protein
MDKEAFVYIDLNGAAHLVGRLWAHADEVCHERLLAGRVGSRRRFALASRRQTALEAGARPFEGTVDRFDGRVEHLGHLVGVVSEHLAQDEHGALASGQDL